MKRAFLGAALIFFTLIGMSIDGASPTINLPCASSPPIPRTTSAKFVAGVASLSIPSTTIPTVRVAYIIPTNRTAQASAVLNLQNNIILYRDWYRQQLERYGFGPKTFNYETEPDGVTPKVYVVPVSQTDVDLRGGDTPVWTPTLDAASAAGVPVWTPGQVWLLVPESHLENANGSITGGTALGASNGSGNDPGVAMVGSDALARFNPALIVNDQQYDNQQIAAVGPYPLHYAVSFPDFEQATFSSTSSSVVGAAAHEMGHAFGLPHNFRNDSNFHGNLMGNGLRGFRGDLYPAKYFFDHTRLGYSEALALNISRYFNATNTFSDNTPPTVSVSTSGSVTATNGILRINFTASDAGGLAAALLSLGGDNTEGIPLSGTNTNGFLLTRFFNPGATTNFTVTIYDQQGNRSGFTTTIVPNVSTNRAPEPVVTSSKYVIFSGENILLDASASYDPDVDSLQVEWDVNGDGVYDTPKRSILNLQTNWITAGNYLVRARLTDSHGAASVSVPIPIKVYPTQLSPRLVDSRSNNVVNIFWPTNFQGHVLEYATVLTPGTWYCVPQRTSKSGTNTLTIYPISSPRDFFRTVVR